MITKGIYIYRTQYFIMLHSFSLFETSACIPYRQIHDQET